MRKVGLRGAGGIVGIRVFIFREDSINQRAGIFNKHHIIKKTIISVSTNEIYINIALVFNIII